MFRRTLSFMMVLIVIFSFGVSAKENGNDEKKLRETYNELLETVKDSEIPVDISFEQYVLNFEESEEKNVKKYLEEYYNVLNLEDRGQEVGTLSGGGTPYYYDIGTSLPSDVNPDYSKYNLKDVVKKGDVIYEANGGFGVTGHIAIVEGFYYNSDQDVTYIRVVEAINVGVVRSLLDDTRVDDKDVTIFRVDDATSSDITAAISFCVGEIGSSYSLDFQKDTDSSETDWYCSELVWAAYKNEGIDIEKSGVSEPGVTPHDIRDSDELSEITFSE